MIPFSVHRQKPEYADQLVFGPRFRILFDGHLEIEKVRPYDGGIYRCVAINKHGSAIAEGTLVVNAAWAKSHQIKWTIYIALFLTLR